MIQLKEVGSSHLREVRYTLSFIYRLCLPYNGRTTCAYTIGEPAKLFLSSMLALDYVRTGPTFRPVYPKHKFAHCQ